MKTGIKPSVLYATCSMLILTSCGGAANIKDTLGIGRKAPDEFRVVSRPPLSVPPQFSLRPPSSGLASPIITPADTQAQSIVTGIQPKNNNSNVFNLKEGSAQTAVTPVNSASLSSIGSGGNTHSGESQFLQNIGIDEADPKIREELVQKEIKILEKKQESSWWNVFSSTKKEQETLVDAKAEKKRILDNKAKNKPITEGETPTLKDKDRGLLGDIFGW